MPIRTVWMEPVKDRNSGDVDYVKSIAKKILSSGIESLTQDERLFWFKGGLQNLFAVNEQLYLYDGTPLLCYTNVIKGSINQYDLNRIENNLKYLCEIFWDRGYSFEVNLKDNWLEDEFLTPSELDRIKQNLIIIIEILSINNFIVIGEEYLDYIKLNTIENEIDKINVLLELMYSSFRFCGTFNCGTDFQF